jgi:hypothetical protein
MYNFQKLKNAYSTEITTIFANRAKVLVTLSCVSTVVLIDIRNSLICIDGTHQENPYKMHHHENRRWPVSYHHYSMDERF